MAQALNNLSFVYGCYAAFKRGPILIHIPRSQLIKVTEIMPSGCELAQRIRYPDGDTVETNEADERAFKKNGSLCWIRATASSRHRGKGDEGSRRGELWMSSEREN